MIGKVMTGKSFYGCISYCLEDKLIRQTNKLEKVPHPAMKGRAEIIWMNLCEGNKKELVQQFREVQSLNPRLAKPVLHITLSLAPGEILAKDQLITLANECARDMGFENNQYLAVLHKDTDTHQHIHIVANRIGFDGKTVSDSNSYKRIASYCRRMEKELGLKQVLSPRKYLSNSQRQLARIDQRKEQLRENIRQSLILSTGFDQFNNLMQDKGYQVIKARGIAFMDDKGVRVKGSELNFSLQTIEKILAQNPGLTLKQREQFVELMSKSSGQTLQPKERDTKNISRDNQSSPGKDFTRGIEKMTNQLLKPEPGGGSATYGNTQDEELIRKKKKKRMRHHL
jgi:MobA/VirD2-like, nuclease domain